MTVGGIFRLHLFEERQIAICIGFQVEFVFGISVMDEFDIRGSDCRAGRLNRLPDILMNPAGVIYPSAVPEEPRMRIGYVECAGLSPDLAAYSHCVGFMLGIG